MTNERDDRPEPLMELQAVEPGDERHELMLASVLRVLKDNKDSTTGKGLVSMLMERGLIREYAWEVVKEASVEYAVRLMAAGLSPSGARHQLGARLAYSRPQCKEIMDAANESQAKLLGMSTQQLTAWAASMYLNVFNSAASKPHVQERVLDGFCRLFGLFKQPSGGSGGGDMTMAVLLKMVETGDRIPIIGSVEVEAALAIDSANLRTLSGAELTDDADASIADSIPDGSPPPIVSEEDWAKEAEENAQRLRDRLTAAARSRGAGNGV